MVYERGPLILEERLEETAYNRQDRKLQVDPDGSIYVGQFVNDKREGYGKLLGSNSDMYDGEWKDSKPHGTGNLTCKRAGSKYEGEWMEGMRHG